MTLVLKMANWKAVCLSKKLLPCFVFFFSFGVFILNVHDQNLKKSKIIVLFQWTHECLIWQWIIMPRNRIIKWSFYPYFWSVIWLTSSKYSTILHSLLLIEYAFEDVRRMIRWRLLWISQVCMLFESVWIYQFSFQKLPIYVQGVPERSTNQKLPFLQ